jgi:hypothetical protein
MLVTMAATIGFGTSVAGAQFGQPINCEGHEATIVGTNGDDIIWGTAGDDVIVGLDGNDIIRGLEGNDVLCGDNGRDRLFGGFGSDELYGGKKNDILKGDQGADLLFGQPGIDRMFGGPGADYVHGGSGTRDKIFGKGGRDTCEDPQATTIIETCEYSSPQIGITPIQRDPYAEALVFTVEEEILPQYGAQHPWLVEAWDHIQTKPIIIDEGGGGGLVVSECAARGLVLPTCGAERMIIGSFSATDQEVLVHELAHVYEKTLAIQDNPSAMGITLLYFEATYAESPCNASELLADALTASVLANTFSPYWEPARCGETVPSDPTSLAVEVARTGARDVDHPWFAQTYSGGEQAWTAIMASRSSRELPVKFTDKFGGYCSEEHAARVVFGFTTDSNPFADGGC